VGSAKLSRNNTTINDERKNGSKGEINAESLKEMIEMDWAFNANGRKQMDYNRK
jgi:hypothetical protein